MNKGDQQSGAEPKNPTTKEDAARIQRPYAKNNMAAKLIKKASQHVLRAQQPKTKTRAKKEGANSLVNTRRIPGD